MKNKKAIIMLIGGLIVGYFVISGSLNSLIKAISKNENTEIGSKETNLSEEEKMIIEYQNERTEKIKKLVKRDLSGDVVVEGEYGIADDTPIVDVEQLLLTDGWKEFLFNEENLVFKYPSDGPQKWWVQKGENSNIFSMATSPSGKPENGSSWAKITFGLYERAPEQSIFEWMEAPLIKEGEEIPPSERTTQYVMIGESKFLGSVFFKDNIWTGQKNVYAEVSPTLIFAASLEVQNFNPNLELVGKFDQLFYTMLNSLEVK